MSEAQTDADAYSVYEYMLWGTHRYSTGSWVPLVSRVVVVPRVRGTMH